MYDGNFIIRIAVFAVFTVGLSSCAIIPEPISDANLTARAEENLNRIAAEQEPIRGPISLNESMARALKYNLLLKVEQAKVSLGKAQLNLSHYNLLPDAILKSGFTQRDNFQASTSLDLVSNTLDPYPSTSQDKYQQSNELTLSWDILDFGLSYVKAKQTADKILISSEIERSTINKLLEQVRIYYWRTATYQRLISRLKSLDSRTKIAIANSQKLSNSNEISKLTALSSERELLKIRKAIKELEHDLVASKAELAQLMNLKPGMEFQVSESDPEHLPLDLSLSLEDMIHAAARNRPELRQNIYEQRINVQQGQANILGLFPSLRGYASANVNSNSYLLNNNWVSMGATVGWSLLKLFQYPAERYVVESEAVLLDRQALALTMSVITQVYVSRLKYDYFRENLDIVEGYRSVQERLTKQMQLEMRASRISPQDLLLEEMNQLIAEAKYDIGYADLQRAYAELLVSMGADIYRPVDPSEPIDAIALQLANNWQTALNDR